MDNTEWKWKQYEDQRRAQALQAMVVEVNPHRSSQRKTWLIRETQVNSALTSRRVRAALGICWRCCQALGWLVLVQDAGRVVVVRCVCWLQRAELSQKKQAGPADKQCWGCYFHEGPWNPDKRKAACTSALGQLGAPAWHSWKTWSSTCYGTERYLPV